MARAEALWEDETGVSRVAPAMIENISKGGAGIRLRHAISVGAKLTIKWHKEQFSGTVRHCSRDEGEYIVGIQRDPALIPNSPTSADNILAPSN